MARTLVVTLALTTAAVLLFLAAVFHWQDRLLHFPERAPVAQRVGDRLRPWPSSQDFRGLVAVRCFRPLDLDRQAG